MFRDVHPHNTRNTRTVSDSSYVRSIVVWQQPSTSQPSCLSFSFQTWSLAVRWKELRNSKELKFFVCLYTLCSSNLAGHLEIELGKSSRKWVDVPGPGWWHRIYIYTYIYIPVATSSTASQTTSDQATATMPFRLGIPGSLRSRDVNGRLLHQSSHLSASSVKRVYH